VPTHQLILPDSERNIHAGSLQFDKLTSLNHIQETGKEMFIIFNVYSLFFAINLQRVETPPAQDLRFLSTFSAV
jgi:hypothetical protein